MKLNNLYKILVVSLLGANIFLSYTLLDIRTATENNTLKLIAMNQELKQQSMMQSALVNSLNRATNVSNMANAAGTINQPVASAESSNESTTVAVQHQPLGRAEPYVSNTYFESEMESPEQAERKEQAFNSSLNTLYDAIEVGVWTDADNDRIMQTFHLLDWSQQKELLSTIAPKINSGELIVEGNKVF